MKLIKVKMKVIVRIFFNCVAPEDFVWIHISSERIHREFFCTYFLSASECGRESIRLGSLLSHFRNLLGHYFNRTQTTIKMNRNKC